VNACLSLGLLRNLLLKVTTELEKTGFDSYSLGQCTSLNYSDDPQIQIPSACSWKIKLWKRAAITLKKLFSSGGTPGITP
jgi:hypothetical protein